MAPAPEFRIREASWPEDLPAVRRLFEAYAASLGFSLCFQDFDAELAGLPGKYAKPAGTVLLAEGSAGLCGCVALRPLGLPAAPTGSDCEMKRLWVSPECRGHALGRRLCESLIAFARAVHYRRMLLDTLSTMSTAIALYESLGFVEIAPYCHNPLPEARYFALVLDAAPT